MEGMNSNIVKWAVASRQMAGETVSGDLHLVKPIEKGVLVVVADGLGHGRQAAEAARLAIDVAAQHVCEPLVRLFEHCNRRLRQTRGVVMSMASFNALDNSMTWLGVGNVDGILVRSLPSGDHIREPLVPSAGVVGVRIPLLRSAVLKVSPGDTLIFATDGIRQGFDQIMSLSLTPERTAEGILAQNCIETDDALVLVASYRGRPK